MARKVVPTCICIHDDSEFLKHVIRSFSQAGPVHVFVSEVAWNESQGNWDESARIAEQSGAIVTIGKWADESAHRRTALAHMRELGFQHVLTPDGDEIPERALLDSLCEIAHAKLAERVRVHIDTYWKHPSLVVRPREGFLPMMMVDVTKAHHTHIREYAGGRHLILGPDYGVVHHLSYVGSDERISRKIGTTSHRDEVGSDWYRRVWKGWDTDPFMRNLHPTHPEAYGWVERIDIPELLKDVDVPNARYVEPTFELPKMSVVIPLYGGPDDIRNCLSALQESNDLLHEVIVVDDDSPDDAPKVVEDFPFVKLIANPVNVGFAATCNRGAEVATGEALIFLNSDAMLPRASLIALMMSLDESRAIGAVGPLSNSAGGSQKTPVTYTTLDTVRFFAEDFAMRPVADEDVDHLVGLCFAIRKETFFEVGKFDTRFGTGLFEDNDLSYRLRRAGYRLKVATNSFVHHEGSRSLHRKLEDPTKLLHANMRLFMDKWSEDVESGFASHLSGMSPSPIIFRPEFHPDKLALVRRHRSKEAAISLCMIVKNEERVLADCLRTAGPYFDEIIVVDTGSGDRTKAIAQDCGCQVYDFPWTKSFADARNESLRHAKGKWIVWLDADDTLPPKTGDLILEAALNASEDIVAFVVPVQFVDQGAGSGTRVDHVKLFRNDPRIRFEGRIHEQILPSINQIGGHVARIDSPVLHSGYDTSEQGQALKRERDWELLNLELRERPDHTFVLFNCGMTAYYCDRFEEAKAWLSRSIEVAGAHDSHVRKAHVLLGLAFAATGELDIATQVFTKGLERVGYDPELLFQRGAIRAKVGDLAGAKADYEAIQESAPGFYSSYDIGILRHKTWHNLAGVLVQLGDYVGAKSYWTRAINNQPVSIPSAIELLQAALDHADIRTAKEQLDLLRSSVNGSPEFATMVERYATALGMDANAALWDESVRNPHSVELPLALVRRLLDQGRIQEAIPILESLRQARVAEASFKLGIVHAQRGEFERSLQLMEEALEFNPGHSQTQEQIAALRSLLA